VFKKKRSQSENSQFTRSRDEKGTSAYAHTPCTRSGSYRVGAMDCWHRRPGTAFLWAGTGAHSDRRREGVPARSHRLRNSLPGIGGNASTRPFRSLLKGYVNWRLIIAVFIVDCWVPPPRLRARARARARSFLNVVHVHVLVLVHGAGVTRELRRRRRRSFCPAVLQCCRAIEDDARRCRVAIHAEVAEAFELVAGAG
jgi:hypothetical protein